MALPNYEDIKAYYLSGKWNDQMLRTALVCKSITKDQFNELVAEKKAAQG
jgi:hypothetical protein